MLFRVLGGGRAGGASGKARWVFADALTSDVSPAQPTFRARPIAGAEAEALLEQNPLAWLDARMPGLRGKEDEETIAYDSLLAPLPNGRSAMGFGVGLNYSNHAKETALELPAFPILFGKAPTSTIGPTDMIRMPRACDPKELDFEVELAVVIGKTCLNVPASRASEVVLGYAVANDVTARKWQGKKRGGGQWTRAKSFDTFMPIGPGIRIARLGSGFDAGNATLSTSLRKQGATGAQRMQHASTKDLIFSVAKLVEFVSQDTTLLPWTVLLTGTPEGVGFTRTPPVCLEPLDTVQVEIEGIGALCNPVGSARQ